MLRTFSNNITKLLSLHLEDFNIHFLLSETSLLPTQLSSVLFW